jgi:hypothetical protein
MRRSVLLSLKSSFGWASGEDIVRNRQKAQDAEMRRGARPLNFMHVILKFFSSNPMVSASDSSGGPSSIVQHFQSAGNCNAQNSFNLAPQIDPSLAHGWPYGVCTRYISHISISKPFFSKCITLSMQAIFLHSIITWFIHYLRRYCGQAATRSI